MRYVLLALALVPLVASCRSTRVTAAEARSLQLRAERLGGRLDDAMNAASHETDELQRELLFHELSDLNNQLLGARVIGYGSGVIEDRELYEEAVRDLDLIEAKLRVLAPENATASLRR